jgi:ABC-2 type transport system ATP-binding protein
MAENLMIEVENLTKRYPGRTAIQGLAFKVNRGEIVGFLGLNGAGKSTTMRILACYMPASSGTARVAGFDVFTQADEVRRRIGYMPENNPLHTDMRVREYLKFRARLKGLSRARSRERVDTVIDQCRLKDVYHKVISQLSKGYRQRVGLADALSHEPELVILDEPTIGLDPHQLRAVRQLIKSLAQNHTVLISTHILSEAEMICSRALILQQGRIVKSDTLANLRRMLSDGNQVVLEILAPRADLQLCFEQTGEIEHFDIAPAEGEYLRCGLTPRSGVDIRPLLFDAACAHGWKIRELSHSHSTLEDVFVHVTRPDREEEGA